MLNILFCGKGGQGIIYASKIFTECIFYNSNFEICASETHGIVRRGGPVQTQIRINQSTIYSPVFEIADYIVDFDGEEAIRYSNLTSSCTKIISIYDTSLQHKLIIEKLPRYTSNLFLLGHFVHTIGMDDYPWANYIKSSDNQKAFNLGCTL